MVEGPVGASLVCNVLNRRFPTRWENLCDFTGHSLTYSF